MAGMIGTTDFMNCVRESNDVAHMLAKFAHDNGISCSWVNERQISVLALLRQL